MECLIPMPIRYYKVHNAGIIGRPLAICRSESRGWKNPKCAQPWEPRSDAHSHEFTPQFSITKLAFTLPYFGDEAVVNLFMCDKKYRLSFSLQRRIRMFIPFECTCSKIVCLRRVCACAEPWIAAPAVSCAPHWPIRLSPLHWFLLKSLFFYSNIGHIRKKSNVSQPVRVEYLCVGGILCYL